ncbi:MAG TPA: hypothetical protein VGM81_19000 [Burkholderiaceae bacterium]|jgi:hypothetical protein
MTPAEAKQIVEVLARGVDPETGEALGEDSPVHNRHVIRALFMAANALADAAAARKPRELPANVGKPWTAEEDRLLCEGFERGLSIAELAEKHARAKGGVRSRLIRLGRLEPGKRAPLTA